MKTLSVFLPLCCAATAALAQVYTPISNLGQPTGGDYLSVSSVQSEANAFTTGNAPTILLGVSISLAGAGKGLDGTLGAFHLSIGADANGSPGTNLTALASANGSDFPTNAGISDYVPTPPLGLLANTTYWIVATSSNTVGGAFYGWSFTPSSNLDSGSSWTLGAAEGRRAGGWLVDSNLNFEFSVTVAAASPPPPAISQPIVITYTNEGVPFVLQQNSDLLTTNWVTVTNATLSGVLSNQVVVILPPNAPKKFYRLASP